MAYNCAVLVLSIFKWSSKSIQDYIHSNSNTYETPYLDAGFNNEADIAMDIKNQPLFLP